MNKEIVIFGTGGHAKVVHDIFIKEGKYLPVAFFSLDNTIQNFLGLPHFHQSNFQESEYTQGIIAVGDNWTRSKIVEFILSKKSLFTFVNAIHPSSQIGNGVVLGTGNVFMANTAINPYSKIGSHVIINTSSSIDHDCQLGDYSSIAPGAVLGGNVTVGEFSAVSLGSKVIHNKKIGKHTIIGSGSLVLSDIEDSCVAYGSPCRIIRKRSLDEKYL